MGQSTRGISGSPRRQGGPQGLSQIPAVTPFTEQQVGEAICSRPALAGIPPEVVERLADLYGWHDLLEEGEADEQTKFELTLLFGAMMGAAAAERGLVELAKRYSKQVVRRLPRQALTKTAYYPIAKQVDKWIGVSVTKRGFAGGVAKVVPVISGFVSAGVTAETMLPMGKRLKNHLRALRYARPNEVG